MVQDFNPRPREEGDFPTKYVGGKCPLISIHALVKRATLDIIDKDILDLISIHALVKRATAEICKSGMHFCISIHALVKRATEG